MQAPCPSGSARSRAAAEATFAKRHRFEPRSRRRVRPVTHGRRRRQGRGQRVGGGVSSARPTCAPTSSSTGGASSSTTERSSTRFRSRSAETASSSVSVELIVANTLRIARAGLSDARLLASTGSRNASYLLEQRAEKVIIAVLRTEGKHAGVRHQLLAAYATTFRYTGGSGDGRAP